MICENLSYINWSNLECYGGCGSGIGFFVVIIPVGIIGIIIALTSMFIIEWRNKK